MPQIISRDIPLSEITLRRYEKPIGLSERDLFRKICLSVGLLQPGDSRDVIVDVFYVLLGDDRIYYPQSTKEIGIFNKRIVMPVGPSKKNINLGPKENFNSWILKIKDNFNRLVSQTAETQMRKKMAEWQVKKVKKMGQIIVDVFTKNPVIPPEISKIQTSHQAINFIEKEIQAEARVKKLLGILVEVTQKYLKPENLKDFYGKEKDNHTNRSRGTQGERKP